MPAGQEGQPELKRGFGQTGNAGSLKVKDVEEVWRPATWVAVLCWGQVLEGAVSSERSGETGPFAFAAALSGGCAACVS